MVVSIDISVLGQILRTAAMATVVSLGLGLWLAWLLTNRQFPGRRELSALTTAALALPAPVICYFVFFERTGLWGVASAVMLLATPMLVRGSRMAFAAIDPGYGKTARSLGASDWRVFWRVEFPMVWQPTAAAVTVVIARVLAEFVTGFAIAERLGR